MYASSIRIICWICFGLYLVTSARADDISPASTNRIGDGLAVHTFVVSPGQVILYVESSGEKFAPKVIGGSGAIGGFTYEFPSSLGEFVFRETPVVVPAGYDQKVGGDYLPLGFLRTDKKNVAPRFHHSWLVDTVLCSDPTLGTSQIFAVSKAKDDLTAVNGFSSCVQAGPMLLADGEPQNAELPNPANKGGLGNYNATVRTNVFACKSDHKPKSALGLGITLFEVTPSDLRKSLIELRIGERKICSNSVALPGNVAGGMMINGKLVGGSGSRLLASAIVFVEKNGRRSTGR